MQLGTEGKPWYTGMNAESECTDKAGEQWYGAGGPDKCTTKLWSNHGTTRLGRIIVQPNQSARTKLVNNGPGPGTRINVQPKFDETTVRRELVESWHTQTANE